MSARAAYRWLADRPRHTVGARVLQVAVGGALLFRLATEAPFAAYLFGPRGLPLPEEGGALAPLFATGAGTTLVLLALALGAAGLVLGARTRASTTLALIAFHALSARMADITDGGDNLMRIVLVYMLFLLPAGARARRGSLAVWSHNLAVTAIVAQVLIVYATSGMMKARGDRWHTGTALYYIAQVEAFSGPALRELFQNPVATTLGTYGAMFHQVLFPVAVFSRLKMAWIGTGVAMHAGIFAMMGLLTFSGVMTGLELFLVTDREYARGRARLRGARRRLVAALRARLPRPAPAPAYRLFVDGYCPRCRAFARLVRRLDRAGRFEVVSFRHSALHEAHAIRLADLERRMHVAPLDGGEVRAGYAALVLLAGALPLLRPVAPLARLAGRLGAGDRLYDRLAARRLLVPPAACDARCRDPSLPIPEEP